MRTSPASRSSEVLAASHFFAWKFHATRQWSVVDLQPLKLLYDPKVPKEANSHICCECVVPMHIIQLCRAIPARLCREGRFNTCEACSRLVFLPSYYHRNSTARVRSVERSSSRTASCTH